MSNTCGMSDKHLLSESSKMSGIPKLRKASFSSDKVSRPPGSMGRARNVPLLLRVTLSEEKLCSLCSSLASRGSPVVFKQEISLRESTGFLASGVYILVLSRREGLEKEKRSSVA